MPLSGLEIFASNISEIEIEGDHARFTLTTGDNRIYIRTTRHCAVKLSAGLARSYAEESAAIIARLNLPD